ncbi:hypothetical protein BDN70DRAFT_912316 [Pholiota conissans]|uniref:Actin cytoskeleton-regulatory complex protein PAN1 n=1 Tax=Pholiota conissans TaxID=109636 RepID=A0A9P5Z5D4_9AGAR|nr:hypothetical protein BDN70DRAFT_912316 [Pholiota conissans]
MAQWGQGQQQGFQYPMQTGFPAGNPQFQQNPQFVPQNPQFQQQNPTFQQQPQFQQGGLGAPNGGGLIPQQTGFPGQRPQGFQQPQQTGFPGGSGFVQPQATGFPGGNFQQNRPAPPPVPPIPSQFQQPAQPPSFLSLPPPQQPGRLLSASPGFAGGGGLLPQPTGFGGRPAQAPLVPQMTGFVDPRIMMMTQTFMPTNTSAPYGPGGVPQLPQQQQNLVTSIQELNQTQRGTTQQQIPWALSKAEKKNYNNIFRSWDAQNTGFINGTTALEVFGASGLPKDDLARIWTLADMDDRGKLNLAEFHVAMGLIYRRLNGMPVPDQLPPELKPPSAKDLDNSVDLVKDLLKHETRSRSPLGETSYLRNRSFTGNSTLDTKRDATIYRHNDNEPPTNFYQSSKRHVNRNAIRARDDDSPASDLEDMKRRLANTAQMLDRAAEAEASKTKEDEELDQEMDDLKYRVKRVQDDLDYAARGPRTASREEEKRRLERELLTLMHERIPEVERKIKARDERKEKERRQWARDRDRANERFGRYDSRDDYRNDDRDRDRDRPYSRGGHDDRDRPYSRGAGLDDRDRPYSRGYDDRDRPRSRNTYDRDDRDDRNRDNYLRDRPSSRSDGRRDDYDRPRSPPRSAPPPPSAPPAPVVREAPAVPKSVPQSTPSPSLKNMTAAEKSAFLKAEAARRIQGRRAALGVTAPTSPVVDTSVEDRLQQEKKEAEEKARAAEKQAEERERARKERLASEKALQEPAPAPTPTTTAPAPAPTPKVAPTPPKRAPAPPPPRKAAAPPAPKAAPPAPKAPARPIAPPAPIVPENDPEEEALRAREEAVRKAKEERERRFQERLRQLEKEEEDARLEEERYQARILEAQSKVAKAATPAPVAPVRAAPPPVVSAAPTPVAPVAPPPPPAPAAPAPPIVAAAVASPQEKSTNPFSRLIKEGATAAPVANGGTNPWAPPPAPTPRIVPAAAPAPSQSPAPKATYNTASSKDEDDWDDIKEKSDDDGDSSDDEITASRAARAKIAQSLFGGMLPRPTSAAASSPASSPATPAPVGGPPPPPAPPAPAPPRAPPAPVVVATGPPDRGALLNSIQGGLKLRPTKTVDKSAPPVSGRVLGDTAPPEHINAAPRPISPPAQAPAPAPAPYIPETLPMAHEDGDRSSYRQSVGWFADRAADIGSSPPNVQSLPSTAEADEDAEDIYESPPAPAVPAVIPEIHVDEATAEPASDLMADIDKSIEHRVRSLYAFEGDGPEDLSFGENLMLVANPSKSGGDWWYGKTVSSGKAGLFPKTYVEVVTPKKAKAVYTYTASNGDELAFSEGETLSIVDTSEEEWWKAEQGGVVFIVPAAYLELVEDAKMKSAPRTDQILQATPDPVTVSIPFDDEKILTLPRPESSVSKISVNGHEMDDSDSDDSDSDYLSFEDSDDDEETAAAKEAREREKQRVLEAAGLIVKQNVGPPPVRPRRPAPAAPRRVLSVHKDLPPVPDAEPPEAETEPEHEPAPEPISHEARLDDAFARYESFKNLHAAGMNRLSVISTESTSGTAVSPTATTTATIPSSASVMSLSPSQSSQKESGGGSGGEGKYSNFLHFLTGGKGESAERERRTVSSLNISAPIMINSPSNQSTPQDGPSRSNSPSFGMSWASLVNRNALEGIPPGERKRQEAIFELINTEVAYVRDLQLIVEVFYSSMLPMLSTKEITVVFANVEDLLLINTAFVSSLEERQKDCRLYVDKIGDILLSHIPNMGAYMEYCVNQSIAIQVLKSLREANPELASHLQHLRDENPTVRNLDLSSYLLAPMQRVTRYPLLIKQIEKYTEVGEEYEAIKTSHDMAEKLLEHINETIRQQEGHETLRTISQNLWIGQGRLDLTAPTRHMGPRRLLKQGVVFKAKSRKKLNAFLCSDILVLLDESMKNLYRMPIPLAYAQVKDTGTRDETGFQISQNYPRGGDALNLRASSARECQQWVQEIGHATKRARHAEERAARKNGRRQH